MHIAVVWPRTASVGCRTTLEGRYRVHGVSLPRGPRPPAILAGLANLAKRTMSACLRFTRRVRARVSDCEIALY